MLLLSRALHVVCGLRVVCGQLQKLRRRTSRTGESITWLVQLPLAGWQLESDAAALVLCMWSVLLHVVCGGTQKLLRGEHHPETSNSTTRAPLVPFFGFFMPVSNNAAAIHESQ
jgi:hypothetical protein